MWQAKWNLGLRRPEIKASLDEQSDQYGSEPTTAEIAAHVCHYALLAVAEFGTI